MYMAEGLPLDFDDSTPDKGAIHGAQGRLKGDMYNASNNDMPVSIAKRFNINLKKLLHNNSMQHPGLKAKSKLKVNTPIILQNRVIGERTMQGATMIELPRLNIADIKIKPTDYEGTCYESAYHDEKVAEQSNHRNCEHCNRNDNSYRPALGYYAMDLITDLPPAGPQFNSKNRTFT